MGNQNSNVKKNEEEIKKNEEEIKESEEEIKKMVKEQITKQKQLSTYLNNPSLIRLPKMLDPTYVKKYKYLKYKQKYLRLKKLLDIN